MITLKNSIVTIFIVLFFVSLAGNIYLSYQLFSAIRIVEQAQVNAKVLAFRDMFVKNVLLLSKEIDFDIRLEMENTVRNLGDQEIFDQWQRFTKCTTDAEANIEAKILLRLLIDRTLSN